MLAISPELTKPELLAELQDLLAQGKHLLSLPLNSAEGFARAEALRAKWSLKNRKLFFRLFEDASPLSRHHAAHHHETHEWEKYYHSVVEDAAHFQQLVLEQMTTLARMLNQLKRLA